MQVGKVTLVNDWALYGHPMFLSRFESLITEAESLIAEDPQGFHRHPHFKLLERVDDSVMQRVPADPGAKAFLQGNTLGKDCRHWRRVKAGLPSRYRLFFQYRCGACKRIVYAWLNDEATLRKDGSRTDVYAVFKALLQKGVIPNSFSSLLDASSAIPEQA